MDLVIRQARCPVNGSALGFKNPVLEEKHYFPLFAQEEHKTRAKHMLT